MTFLSQHVVRSMQRHHGSYGILYVHAVTALLKSSIVLSWNSFVGAVGKVNTSALRNCPYLNWQASTNINDGQFMFKNNSFLAAKERYSAQVSWSAERGLFIICRSFL